ncbi:MAG: MFS transporter [Armatimonadetes bacterium]|nr:MFS transporter [Armatimonadota bacterium]
MTKRLHYGWVLLGIVTLAIVSAMGVARQGYSIILPAMQTGLGLNNTQAGMLATANLTAYLVLALVGGALASHFGPRVVITSGLFLVAAGLLATGRAQSFAAAALWRAITGVGTGATNVPAMGLISAWFAPNRRGLGTGIAVTGSSVALILLGPTVPPVLAAYPGVGWRLCWYGFAAFGLVVAILAALLLRNRPGPMGLRPIGESDVVADDTATVAPVPSTGPSWRAVYASGAVWHLGFVYIAYGFSYIIYVTFFVKGLIAEGGYSQSAAGQLFMVMGWCALFCGLIWGWVSDAIGRKAALIIVYLIQTIAFGLYALHPHPLGFTVSAVLFGITAWSIPGIIAAASGDLFGPRLAPATLGFVTVFLGVGQAAGPTVAGMIADARHSLLPAMLLASAVALLGALLAATLHPIHGKRPA